MIRMRSAYWCNVKALMLLLAVYGHWIEPEIGTDACMAWQYRWIYLVHMPMFAFLSGLFINSARDCIRQIKRFIPLYTALQGIAAVLTMGKVDLLTPWWYLWYLLSMCIWCCAGFIWFSLGGRGRVQLPAASLCISILAGCVPWMDRTLSLSRTAAFLPFFTAGLVVSPDVDFRKYRVRGLAAGVFTSVIAVLLAEDIPVEFLYHAEPYVQKFSGAVLRLVCCVVSAALCVFILAFTPDIRFPWTRWGADTLPAYLVHGPMVGFLRMFWTPWPMRLLASMVLLTVAEMFFRGIGGMYGIARREGRGVRGCFSGDIQPSCPGCIPVSHSPDPG